MNSFDALINIDEASFSRFTKATRCWSAKGKEAIVENICFSNFTSLITAITTFGDVFAASIVGWVNILTFMKYLDVLEDFY